MVPSLEVFPTVHVPDKGGGVVLGRGCGPFLRGVPHSLGRGCGRRGVVPSLEEFPIVHVPPQEG